MVVLGVAISSETDNHISMEIKKITTYGARSLSLVPLLLFVLLFLSGCSSQGDFSQLKLNLEPDTPRLTTTSGSPSFDSDVMEKTSVARNHGAVEVFVTSWCPHCKRVESFLKKHNVQYTRYDIEHDAQGQQKHAALGESGVPIITIGNEVVRGFNQPRLKQLLGIGESSHHQDTMKKTMRKSQVQSFKGNGFQRNGFNTNGDKKSHPTKISIAHFL